MDELESKRLVYRQKSPNQHWHFTLWVINYIHINYRMYLLNYDITSRLIYRWIMPSHGNASLVITCPCSNSDKLILTAFNNGSTGVHLLCVRLSQVTKQKKLSQQYHSVHYRLLIDSLLYIQRHQGCDRDGFSGKFLTIFPCVLLP